MTRKRRDKNHNAIKTALIKYANARVIDTANLGHGEPDMVVIMDCDVFGPISLSYEIKTATGTLTEKEAVVAKRHPFTTFIVRSEEEGIALIRAQCECITKGSPFLNDAIKRELERRGGVVSGNVEASVLLEILRARGCEQA